ncbi:MAG: LysR family transcriptional regulator [Pseudomonadota bacterium]
MNELSWDAVRCFIAVARTGSITRASEDLGLSIATVSRRLDHLEGTLDVLLLRRGPDGARLTPEGERLFRHADPGRQAFDQFWRTARALRQGDAETPVRISSTESVVADLLAPHCGRLFEAAPAIKIEFDVDTRRTDLNAGEADLAIRLAKPVADGLVARRLASIPLGLYCSAAYLGGRRSTSLTLSEERLLWVDPRYGDIPENQWLKAADLEAQAVIRSASVRALRRAAEDGAGIALLPKFSVKGRALKEIPVEGLPVRAPWLVFHRDTRRAPRLKIVRDWIVDCFADAGR